MTWGYIRYRSEYKYQLASAYQVDVGIVPKEEIETEFVELDGEGLLTIKKAYAWDGPSGPVIDTPLNMRASVVHDALYQLMRLEELKSRKWRKTADKLFRDICKEDGVPSITANTYYRALRKFGKPAASPMNKKKIHEAPGQ